MTESEWLTSTDPHGMLAFLRASGCASERKLRLFGAAVCRRLWPLLTDERSRTAVELTEGYADGERERGDIRQASNEAYRAWEDASFIADDPGEPPNKVLYGSSRAWRQRPYEDDPLARRYLSPHPGMARFHAAYAAFMLTVSVVERVLSDSQEAVWFGTSQGQRSAVATEVLVQAAFLRDLFGPLPFRAVRLDPTWLTWNDSAVVKVAQSLYEDRHLPEGTLDRAHLGVLADALEEAGCTNPDLLAHCRSGERRVRGCWTVDLLLGKE